MAKQEILVSSVEVDAEEMKRQRKAAKKAAKEAATPVADVAAPAEAPTPTKKTASPVENGATKGRTRQKVGTEEEESLKKKLAVLEQAVVVSRDVGLPQEALDAMGLKVDALKTQLAKLRADSCQGKCKNACTVCQENRKRKAAEAPPKEAAAVAPEVDEEEEKRKRKAAKKAAKEAAVTNGDEVAVAGTAVAEVDEEEAKRQRKAAKKAAKEAEEQKQPETPKKGPAKRPAQEAEIDNKEEAPKAKKSKKPAEEEATKPEAKEQKKGSRKDMFGGIQEGNDLTAFIRGLPWAADEEKLQRDFSECGEIDKIKLPKNEEGKSRGMAFVKFLTQEGVDAAMKFDNTDYGGRTIYVTKAGENTQGAGKDGKGKGKGNPGGDRDNVLTVCIKGLAYSVEQETVRLDFVKFGEIAKMTLPRNEEGESKGIAFITYKTQEGFDAAVKLNETEYHGRTITVNKPLIREKGDKGTGKGAKDKDGKQGKGKGKDGKSKGKDSKGKAKDGKGKGKDSKDATKEKVEAKPDADSDSS